MSETPNNPPLKGFAPFEAALRLLRALGREAPPAWPGGGVGDKASGKASDKTGGEAGDDDIPALLEMGDHRGRLVEINAEDIAFLTLPTLVQLKSGGWVLLHSRSGERLSIEGADGHRQTRLASEHISGKAIDRLGVLPEGSNIWIRIGRLLLAHKSALVQVAAVSVLMQALSMVAPLITRTVMDDALPQASPSLLALAVWGVLLTTLASSSLGLIRDWTGVFIETRLDAIAQRGILDHTLKLPFSKLMGRTAGETMQAFTGLSMAKDLLGQRLLGTLMDAVTACGYLVLILAMWPKAAGIIVGGSLALAALSLGSGFAQAVIQRRAIPVQIAERDSMLQTINGIATVKAAGVEEQSLCRWWERYARLQALGLKRQRVGLWNEIGLDSVQQLMTLVILVEGGRQALAGNLSIGTLFAVLQMGASLSGAVLGAANLGISFIIAKPQMEKAQEILSLEQEPRPPAIPSTHMTHCPDILMEDVWFRYSPDDPWVLKGLNLNVEAGGRHRLRWPSGAGKSTLLRLMGGLLEPGRGQALIGGRRARDMRPMVAYMPQNVQIYGSSVIENLAIFSCRAPMEKIMAAAEKSGLAKLVATFPMGYDTVLSYCGGNISGGQRQLILLTAAMATERRVLLLDEAFANLDNVSRAEILRGDWFGGKTVVYAGHGEGTLHALEQ